MLLLARRVGDVEDGVDAGEVESGGVAEVHAGSSGQLDDVVAGLPGGRNEAAADETGGSGDGDAHAEILLIACAN